MAALDAQSNWNVEMPQLQTLSISSESLQLEATVRIPGMITIEPNAKEIFLPAEIISHIMTFLPHRRPSQHILWACCLTSRTWYQAAIERLYSRPYLHGGNFNEFVTTVCPSKNAHIRQSAVACFIKSLDMGDLVHNASKSLTARLLGRLKGNIEEFVAPQASFAINSFAALSKCTKLRHLDLSLISASISHTTLFQALQSLQDLEVLFLPRTTVQASVRTSKPISHSWPPKLKSLHLAGGIDDEFLTTRLLQAPKTLENLSIQHCSRIFADAINEMLQKLGPQLKHLTIRHPMPQLEIGALDTILLSCRNLRALRISADYISNTLFNDFIPPSHPLQIIDLECSPIATEDVNISPGRIYDAVENGLLPDLRVVRASSRLAWGASKMRQQDTKDLLEIMEENESERPMGFVVDVDYSQPE